LSFVVVRVQACYDHIEDVLFVKQFDDELSANDYIQNEKQRESYELIARRNNIEGWVDALKVPENLNHTEWVDYLKPYFGEHRFVRPQDFKQELKNTLRSLSCSFQAENYNPPQITIQNSHYLFAINIAKEINHVV